MRRIQEDKTSKNAGFNKQFIDRITGMEESANVDGRDRRVVEEGAIVVSNRVSPDVDEKVIDDLLDEGIVGAVDYDTGPSLDPEALPEDNTTGRGSLNDFMKFSRVGGYLVAHKNELDRIVAGRARPGSLRLENIEMADGSVKVLKCVQLDAYAELDEDEFDGIRQISGQAGLSRHTFTDLEDKDEIEQVVAAVTMLEREGRLRYR